MTFDFTDIILSLGIVQGFFLAMIIGFRIPKNIGANKILSIFLITCALVLAGKMSISHFFSLTLFKFLSLTDNIVFLFGPLFYTYIRRLIVKSESPFKLSLSHYLPAIIHFIIFCFFAILNEAAYIEWLRSTTMNYIFNSVELLGLTSGFFYWYKSYSLIKHYNTHKKQTLSYHQSLFKFLTFFMTGIILCLAAWSFSYIDSYYLSTYFDIISYNTIWVVLCVFIYTIGFYSLTQPEILRLPIDLPSKDTAQKLTNDQISDLKQELERLLTTEKLHYKADLNLGEFAGKLGVSSNNLSWLLNSHYKQTFYDFINQHRINAFLERVENGDHTKQTLSSIALEVGFNSKSTFNRVFKKHLSLTPSQYITKKSDTL